MDRLKPANMLSYFKIATFETNSLSNRPPDVDIATANSSPFSGRDSSEASIAKPLFAMPATHLLITRRDRIIHKPCRFF